MKQKQILLEKKIGDLKDKHAENLEIVLRELAHFEADIIQKLADLRLRITLYTEENN
jgi:hypothetical protein